MRMTSTKILCTIGPASAGARSIERLIKGGMDVARLNFSHGEHATHIETFSTIRQCAQKLGAHVAILQDLQGIKIRTGTVAGGQMMLKRGDELVIRPGVKGSDGQTIYISYAGIVADSRVGSRILIDDGLLHLTVTELGAGFLRARVIEGGPLRDRKGVNLPDIAVRAHAFTDKDRRDLELGVRLGVDYVAVSFVREAADMLKVRQYLRRAKSDIPLIAKIEKPEALSHIDEIIEASDGLMVARGDLGVELSPEQVPMIQKMLIRKANEAGKPVITATQMLESMTKHSTPTRAEANDVANAVIDGSDALMLSAETSSGSFPIQSVQMMDRIIRATEASGASAQSCYSSRGTYSEAVAEAAVTAARDIGARYIVAFTHSGYTARLLSHFRPEVPIIALTASEAVARRMALYWGVMPMLIRPLSDTDEVFREVELKLKSEGLVRKGDSLVITASAPIGGAGKTNLMKLHKVG